MQRPRHKVRPPPRELRELTEFEQLGREGWLDEELTREEIEVCDREAADRFWPVERHSDR